MKKINILVLSYLISFFVLGNNTYAFGEDKLNIAVMNFQGQNISAMDAVIITGFIRSKLVKSKKFKIIDKTNMDIILNEQGFQQTGCTDQECAVQMGKILNVHKMINGTVSKLLGTYYITANCIDVETGEIQFSENIEFKEEEKLKQKTEEITDMLIADITGEKLEVIPKEQKVQEEPVSKIPNFKEITSSLWSTKYEEWQYIVKNYNYEEMQIAKKYLEKALNQTKIIGRIGLVTGIGGIPTLILGIDNDNDNLLTLGILMCIPGVICSGTYIMNSVKYNKKLKEVKRICQEKGWTLSMNNEGELRLAYNIYW